MEAKGRFVIQKPRCMEGTKQCDSFVLVSGVFLRVLFGLLRRTIVPLSNEG